MNDFEAIESSSSGDIKDCLSDISNSKSSRGHNLTEWVKSCICSLQFFLDAI